MNVARWRGFAPINLFTAPNVFKSSSRSVDEAGEGVYYSLLLASVERREKSGFEEAPFTIQADRPNTFEEEKENVSRDRFDWSITESEPFNGFHSDGDKKRRLIGFDGRTPGKIWHFLQRGVADVDKSYRASDEKDFSFPMNYNGSCSRRILFIGCSFYHRICSARSDDSIRDDSAEGNNDVQLRSRIIGSNPSI